MSRGLHIIETPVFGKQSYQVKGTTAEKSVVAKSASEIERSWVEGQDNAGNDQE